MGADGIEDKLDRELIMSLEDVAQFARIACAEGIKYIRLTGGEPLVRLGIVDLVRELSQIPQLEDLSMTSNGQLFGKYAEDLKNAGLSRITFSLDSTDATTYEKLTRGGDLVKVYSAIDEALRLGYSPVKINALAYQLTEDDLLNFIRMTEEKPIHVRFIEYMPIGFVGREARKCPTPPPCLALSAQSTAAADCSNNATESRPEAHQSKPLLTMGQIRDAINELASTRGLSELKPLKREKAPLGHGPASSYAFDEAQGSFGFIAVHSQNFCADCNRLRLTADGKIRSCLFSDLEIPIGAALQTKNRDSLRASLLQAVASKPLSYAQQQGTKRTMSAIGG